MNRQLSVSLKCPDSTKTEWDGDLARAITESVTESPTCHYQLTFESPLACPRQCIVSYGSKYAVCSTHGICAADPNAGRSHCLCDDGYGGDLCQNLVSGVEVLDAGNEDLMDAVIVCVVLMTLCCGVAVYLWYVWKREAKMNRVMEHHEAFLGIDDDVKMDEDVEAMMKRIEQTTDTFHSNVTVDVNEAKMIQDELKRKKRQSAAVGV